MEGRLEPVSTSEVPLCCTAVPKGIAPAMNT
jgi:hypothetical protein